MIGAYVGWTVYTRFDTFIDMLIPLLVLMAPFALLPVWRRWAVPIKQMARGARATAWTLFAGGGALAVIAISKFQAENQMEVTGEVTPQLAGVLSAQVSNPNPESASASAPPVASEPVNQQAALQAAQRACLEEKMRKEQEKQQKKRGFGHLMSAVTRTAGQQGNYDIAQKMNDVSQANATFDDLAAAAKDFGLSKKQIAKCENPG